MIFLTAPLDVQQSPAYECALALLVERHGSDQLAADRDLFEDMKTYNKSWKQVYDPQKAAGLYLLAREDGTHRTRYVPSVEAPRQEAWHSRYFAFV